MIIPGETIVAMRRAEDIERDRRSRADAAGRALFEAQNPGGRWFLMTDHQKGPWLLRARDAG